MKVWLENPQTGEVRHTSSAYLTFVAIGEGGKPAAVAPVMAESQEEERRYHEAAPPPRATVSHAQRLYPFNANVRR